MEYLKPIETLQSQLRKAQFVIIALVVLLGICLVAVPRIAALGSPVIVETDAGARLMALQPWKSSIARLEGFTRSYLSARFDWAEVNFSKKRELLRSMTNEATFSKFKESLTAFETLGKEQKARSYYILEQVQFANGEETLRANVTRVLRVRNVAFATPLNVTLSYENAPITEANPYGLIINGVKEAENDTH